MFYHIFSSNPCRFLSPDGRSYMFDQRANGYSRGEGIATLVVKTLSEALKSNDPIHAIVRNTGMNQDGRTPGITMPSEDAQRALIQATYQDARLDPSETDFFEAHGTGTQAGDRVEAAALSSALGTSSRPLHKPLYVGSIKTILGHTEACSGAAGVLHAVMALSHKAIVPNCNFEFPSDQIDFDAWRIKVGDLCNGTINGADLCRFLQNSKPGPATTHVGLRSTALATVVRTSTSFWKKLQTSSATW